MLVYFGGYEFTFYIGANGVWTMHIYERCDSLTSSWVDSHYNVSKHQPRIDVPPPSTVSYNAWD